MKNYILLLFTVILFSSCANNSENTTLTVEENKQLRHVVLFQFKDSASSADVTKVETAFISLTDKIKEIKDLEWGLNNSTEELNKGFTHCFFVTFDSEADRSVYLPHPAHLAFVEVLKPHLKDVLVLDYWTK